MLGKDDIKAETLNKYQKSRIKAFSYNELYHHIIPLYKEDGALCNLLFELTEKWGEDIKTNTTASALLRIYFATIKPSMKVKQTK